MSRWVRETVPHNRGGGVREPRAFRPSLVHVRLGGALFLEMPGFGFASIVCGHEVSRFGPWMFLGNFVFYTAVLWSAVSLLRRIRGR